MKNAAKSRNRHCEPKVAVVRQKVTEPAEVQQPCVESRDVAIQGCLLLVVLFALFLVFPSSASAKMDRSDSSYVSTLNMTDEQKEKVYGVDSATLAKGPTLQELNEENPTYVKREYDHKQQVVVGSVVMFCVALAMVLMNNYNPKR